MKMIGSCTRWRPLFAVLLLLLSGHVECFHKQIRSFIYGKHVSKTLTTAFTASTVADVDSYFSSFEAQFYDALFDADSMSRLHTETIFSLVKSDRRNREEDSSQLELFPSSYKKAIQFIDDFLSTLRDTANPLHSSARMITKKEGFNQWRSLILDADADIIMPQREIVDVKRKTERVLSQLMTLCVAYRCCEKLGNERDLIYFSKALLEKVPIHDRHFALLLLSRGILAPPYASRRKSEEGATNDVSSLVRLPRPGLTDAFKSSSAKLGVNQPSTNARVLFPFACTALRCYRAVKSGAFDEVASKQYQYQYQTSSRDKEHGAAIVARREAARSKHTSTDSDTSIAGSVQPTADKDKPEKAETNAKQLAKDKKISKGSKGGSYTAEDVQLGALLKACLDIDREAESQRSMTEAADEVLTSMRRWICDLTAAHFINDDDSLFNQRDSLPEEIRRNTVAMELVCTERAFVKGKKLDRSRFVSFFAEIGRYIDVMTSFVTGSSSTDDTSLFDDGDDDSMDAYALYDPNHKFLVSMKKTIAAISAAKYLPRTHRLRALMESGGAAGTGLFTPPVLIASPPITSSPSTVAGTAKVSAVDRDSSSDRDRVSEDDGFVDIFADPNSKDDDDIWASERPTKKINRVQQLADTFVEPSVTEKLTPAAALSQQVDNYLLQVIADILRVNESVVLGPKSKVREEVDYVFSSWRRPHLLLDYYRMHHSSPEIQALFRRFLSALFGVSSETVDDLRYNDAGNRRHLNLFPPSLVKQWADGKTSSGKLLPGYTDPQTLFMLGEDCNTCMSIRARQKGTNRGLLSILLQGNIRVVGAKDSSGRLVTRSVVRLVLDDATKMPVLYVDTPYGNLDDEDSLLQVYDQAAELGNMLRLPVIYASTPSDSLYVMSSREISAAVPAAPEAVNRDDDEDDDIFSGTGSTRSLKSKIGSTLNVADLVQPLTNLTDYSQVCSLMWVDGIKDPQGESYLPTRSPLLTRRPENARGLAVGARTVGALESMVAAGVDVLPPVTQQKRVASEPTIDTSAQADDDIFAPSGPGDRDVSASSRRSASLSADGQFDTLFKADDDLFGDDDEKRQQASVAMRFERKPEKAASRQKDDGDLFADAALKKKKKVTLSSKVDFGEDSDFFGEAEKFIAFNKTSARARNAAAQVVPAAASLAGRSSFVARRLGGASDPKSSQGMSKELLQSEDTNFEGSFLSTTMNVDEATSSALSGGDYYSLLAALKNQQAQDQKQSKPTSAAATSSVDSKPRKRQTLSVQARQAERNRMIRDHQFELQRARGLRKDEEDGAGDDADSSSNGDDNGEVASQESRTETKSQSSPSEDNTQRKPVRKPSSPPPRVEVEEEDDGLWG